MHCPRGKRSVFFLGLVGLLGSVQAAEVATGGPLVALLSCMRANLPASTRSQDVELRTDDKAGATRTLSTRLLTRRVNGKNSVVLRVMAPADLQGAAFLSTPGKAGQEYYLYLPAVAKPRRIDGSSGGNLFGTGLGYNEIRQMSEAFADATLTLGPAGTLNGRKVRQLFATTADARSPYDTVSLQVDTLSCLLLAADFMAGDKLIKQLRVEPSSISRSGGFWTAGSSTVRDLRSGQVTTITSRNVQDGASLSDSDFSPKSFYKR